MKYIEEARCVELTTRNLNALWDKLSDAQSARTIGSPCQQVRVRAVEDEDRSESQTDAAESEGLLLVTRSELAAMLAGETVNVAGTAIVPVPDASHYNNRPAGDVYMPSSGELRRGVMVMSLRHICEVCGRDEILTPTEAFEAGWDYPPKMGTFGVISPRCCPDCPNTKTVWWAISTDGFTEDMLTDAQRATVARILAGPSSIMLREPS